MLALFGDMSVPCALRYLEAALEALLGASSKGRGSPRCPAAWTSFRASDAAMWTINESKPAFTKLIRLFGRLTGFYREVSHR